MSIVYLCERTELEPHEVAVKRLLPEINAIPGAAENFLRECFLWLQLGGHPNVVEALSAHQAPPEPPMLVLEYVPMSLRDMLVAHAPSLHDSLLMAVGMVNGMQHAASSLPGFIHADLKPENILIGGGSTAKVTDLGLARALTNIQGGEAIQSKSTRVGVPSVPFIGTPMYMAPEQALGAPPEAASDVYALGCIIYEMLAGEPVFGWPRGGDADYLLRHVHRNPLSLARLRSDIPKQLADVVGACLGKDPARRPTLDELAHGLRSVARALGIEPGNPIPQKPDPSRLTTVAQAMVNLGLREDAIRLCRKVLALNPELQEEVLTRLLLARIQGERGNWEVATQELDTVEPLLDRLTVDNQQMARTVYLSERSRVASGQGDPQKAVEYLKEATKQDPGSSVIWYNLGVSYIQLGQPSLGIEPLKKAVNYSADLRYLDPLVLTLANQGRSSEAMHYANFAVEIHPGSGYAHAIRALAVNFLIQDNPTQFSSLINTLADDVHIGIQAIPSNQVPPHLVEYLNGMARSLWPQ